MDRKGDLDPDKLRIIRFVRKAHPRRDREPRLEPLGGDIPGSAPLAPPKAPPAPPPEPRGPAPTPISAKLSFWQVMFSFNGRIGRAQFLGGFILTWVTLAVVPVVISAYGGVSLVGFVEQFIGAGFDLQRLLAHYSTLLFVMIVVWIIGCWMSWATTVKRWHDLDKSGWWVFWTTIFVGIPYVGWVISLIILVYLFLVRGTIGPNRYGPDPLGHMAPGIQEAPGAHVATLVNPDLAVRASPSALEGPRERLARGEITLEEYQRIRAVLKEE